jgi:hypothetical protein
MEKLETLLVVDPLEEEVRKDHSRAEEEIAFKTEMECDEPQCILPDWTINIKVTDQKFALDEISAPRISCYKK